MVNFTLMGKNSFAKLALYPQVMHFPRLHIFIYSHIYCIFHLIHILYTLLPRL